MGCKTSPILLDVVCAESEETFRRDRVFGDVVAEAGWPAFLPFNSAS